MSERGHPLGHHQHNGLSECLFLWWCRSCSSGGSNHDDSSSTDPAPFSHAGGIHGGGGSAGCLHDEYTLAIECPTKDPPHDDKYKYNNDYYR